MAKSEIKTIPKWVKVGVNEVCMDGDEINSKYMGKQIFILMMENNSSLSIIACPCPHMKDVAFYANYFNTLKRPIEEIDCDEIILARVKVMNPSELPFDSISGESIFLIYEDWYLMEHDNMEDVTSDIENVIDTHLDSKIEDFCVLMGTEVSPKIKTSLLKAARLLQKQTEEKIIDHAFAIS